MDNKDYTNLSLEELLKEEQKLKKNETLSRFLIGFLVGIMIFGVVNKGFGVLHVLLPLLLISAIYKNSQNQKKNLTEVQSAINTQSTNS